MSYQYQYYIGLAFSLNYMMGSGFLSIPWAVNKCGIAFGIIILIFITYVCFVSSILILKTIRRAELIKIYESHQILLRHSSNNYHSIDNRDNNDIHILHSNSPLNMINIEYGELCQIFLGNIGNIMYTMIISIYIYGSLWSYITIFANAMTLHYPIGLYSYYYYLCLYMSIVFPLSCIGLSNQITLQLLLTFGRISLVTLMISTICFKYFTFQNEFDLNMIKNSNYDHNIISDIVSKSEYHVKYFKPSGIHNMLAISLCATIFHHSIPNLKALMNHIPENELIYIFRNSLMITFTCYLSLGIIVSIYFESNIKTSANLNWIVFINDDDIHGSSYYHNILSYISSYIILFPAINVISSFPLNAITLGNNLYIFCYGVANPLNCNSANIAGIQQNIGGKILFRFLACLPPVLLACISNELGNITTYTGLVGFAIVCIYPALLASYSKQYLKDRNVIDSTPIANNLFQDSFENPIAIILMFFIGMINIIYILIFVVIL